MGIQITDTQTMAIQTTETPILEFCHVTGKTRKFHLDDISFALPAGYLMGLAGANGAGKSTLVDTIMNPRHNYTGTIRFMGEDIRENHTAALEHLGLVSERNSFLERYSAEQNAMLLGKLYESFDFERFKEAMKKMELSAAKTVGAMSRGERMRFQMAFAMAHDTRLYLLDEATAGLDPVFRHDFLHMVQTVMAEEGASVLMVTHLTEELEQKADYVGIMEAGRLISFGENTGSVESMGSTGSVESMKSMGSTGSVGSVESMKSMESAENMENTGSAKSAKNMENTGNAKSAGIAGSTGITGIAGIQETAETKASAREDGGHQRKRIREFEGAYSKTASNGMEPVTNLCIILFEVFITLCLCIPFSLEESKLFLGVGVMLAPWPVWIYLNRFLFITEEGKTYQMADKLKYFPVDRKELQRVHQGYLVHFLKIPFFCGMAAQLLTALIANHGLTVGNVICPLLIAGAYPFLIGQALIHEKKRRG